MISRYADRKERLSRGYASIGNGFDTYCERVRSVAEGRRELECGCGFGALAIDMASVAVSGGLRNMELRVDNAEQLALPDKSVDVVVGTGIVHHLDIGKATRQVRRVLSNSGIALFAKPRGHDPVLNW